MAADDDAMKKRPDRKKTVNENAFCELAEGIRCQEDTTTGFMGIRCSGSAVQPTNERTAKMRPGDSN